METLSTEYITQLNFNRSKKWATFLREVNVTKTTDDIINFAENENEIAFKNDDDDDYSDLLYMEDNETEPDDSVIRATVLEDITNCSRMIMTLSDNNGGGKCINEVSIRADDDVLNDSAKLELVDLLNHTVPIINEYKRQIKESGLENVLNTFDTKKIEEKEDDWHKNKTLMTATQNVNNIENNDCYQKVNGKKTYGRPVFVLEKQNQNSNKYNNKSCIDEMSSDESLHSCDLARYVRSTKYCTPQVNSLKKIKTFCTVEGKREELRQKYACYPDYDDETYLTAVRHRRKHFSFNDVHQDYYNRLYHRHYDYESNEYNINKLEPRKKVLRKRPMLHRNCSAQCSDTESDDEDIDIRIGRNQCMKAYHCRHSVHYHNQNHHENNRKLMKRTCTRHVEKKQSARSLGCVKIKNDKRDIRKYYRKYQKYTSSLSSSSSSSSPRIEAVVTSSFKNLTCKEKICCKMNREYHSDPRAYKRESECQCYNNGKLCPIYKHLAETSNEEWFVENYFTIKERASPSPSPTSRPATSNINDRGTSTVNGERPAATTADTKRQPKIVKEKDRRAKIKNPQSEKILSAKQQQHQQENEDIKIFGKDSDGEFDAQLQMVLLESFRENAKQELFQQELSTATASRQNDSQGKLIKNRSKLKRHYNNNDRKYDNNEDCLESGVCAIEENKFVKKIPKLQLTNREHSRIHKNNGKEKRNYKNSNLNWNDKDCADAKKENSMIIKAIPKFHLMEPENSTIHKNYGRKNKKHSTSITGMLNFNNNEVEEKAETEAHETESFNYCTPGVYNSTAITTSIKSPGKAKVKPKGLSVSLRKRQLSKALTNEQIEVDQKSSKKINTDDKSDASVYKNKFLSTSILNQGNQKENSCATHSVSLVVSSGSNLAPYSASATVPISNSISQCEKLTSSVKRTNNINDNVDINDLVSSTTQMEATESVAATAAPALTAANVLASKSASIKKSNNQTLAEVKERSKGVLIYTPDFKNQLAPNGYFEVTKDYLSTVIGKEAAKKFLKYYVGRRRFHYTSTIYFRPSLTNTTSNGLNDDYQNDDDHDRDCNEDSSDDDNDVLECCSQYGYLYESIQSDDEKYEL